MKVSHLCFPTVRLSIRVSVLCIFLGTVLSPLQAVTVNNTQQLYTVALHPQAPSTVELSHQLTSTADETVLALTALPGNTTARFVGATDFVTCSPQVPADIDLELITPVPFTTADGQAGFTRGLRPLHPLFPSGQYDRFPGPERNLAAPDKTLPPPFDYDENGQALGLRIRGTGQGLQHSMNHIRHNRDHNGHIVWVAEYLMQDGSIQTFWEELPMTRANAPMFRPRRETIERENPATHLRKLVTLEIASAEAMMVDDKADSPDPRRWKLQPKRMRREFTPRVTLRSEDGAMSLRQLQEALLEVPINAQGGINGLNPGEPFVIELPPVLIESFEEVADGERFIPFRDKGVAEHLAQLTQNRIFLVGTPGKTIFPAMDLTLVRNLDFGWITVSPVQRRDTQVNTLQFGRECDVRFFGCVIDTVDYSSHGTINITGGQVPGPRGQEPVRGAWIEFYDGYIGDTEGPTFSYANQKLSFDAMPRLIIARSIIDVSNDGISFYGQGMALLESNYWYGGGGRWNEKSGSYQHRDMIGQIIPMGTDKIAYAFYHNLIGMGKNLSGSNMAMRGSGSLLMYQSSCDYASEITGNIFENNGHMRGITGLHTQRQPLDGRIGKSWGYGTHVAENILYERPDNIANGLNFPYVQFGGYTGAIGSMDSWAATSNITPFMGGKLQTTGFMRALNLFPEEENGWSGQWISIRDYKRGRDTQLKSGRVIRGTQSGAVAVMYSYEMINGKVRIFTFPASKSFLADEDLTIDEFALGSFVSISLLEPYNNDRAGYLTPQEAFANFPEISGTWQKGYSLDWANTRYAGTGREGYLSAYDLYVAPALRRFSIDGKSGGPNLPQHGDYLKRYLELPEDFNLDLLGFDLPSSGYLKDWYGQWAPKPFKLKGELNQPWTPMPGTDKVAEKDLILNLRIADLGTGTLAEEVAADGSNWRLEVLDDGSHRPRFTVRDSQNEILYQVTSALPLKAQNHLLVGISTQHRSWGIEYIYATTHWMRWIWNHAVREQNTSDLILRIVIQAEAPSHDLPLVAGETLIWIDTRDNNFPKVSNGQNWEVLQGDLSEALPSFILGLAAQNKTYTSRYLGTNTLAEGQFRIFGATNPLSFKPATAPQPGDFIIYAKTNALPFNEGGAAYSYFKDGKWELSPRLPQALIKVPHGDVRGYIRIDSQQSMREADWIWSNRQQDLLSQTYAVRKEDTRREIAIPAGSTEIETTLQLMDPAHINVYLMGPKIQRRQLLVLGEDYQVENIGVKANAPKAKVVFLKPLLNETGDRVYIEANIPPEAEDNYNWDHNLPRGVLKLGQNTANPFTGTVNYFEARRQKGHSNQHLSLEIPGTGIQHRFARQPIDPKTGERDTPLLPAADVWVTAETVTEK